MSVDSLAGHLCLLLKNGAVPCGSIAKRDWTRMQSLLDAGVLSEERKGAGKRIVLKNRPALESFIRSTYPSGLSGETAEALPPRSRAVARMRDAKQARRGEAEPVLLRGFGKAAFTSGSDVLPVADWTKRAGAAALLLGDGSQWSFSGTIAVVENQEVFLHFEKLGVPANVVLYAGGRLSERVITWLASPAMERCALLHCGDYDPVGLDEYLRLSRACSGRAKLHLPSDIEALFKRFGKSELVEKSQSVLKRLRKNTDPKVRVVVDFMDRYGAGLEQEALLIGGFRRLKPAQEPPAAAS